MARDPQAKYQATRPNDILEHLVAEFEKQWKQKRQPITTTEITNVCNTLSAILAS